MSSITSRLIEEFGYPEFGAELVANKLSKCSLEIQEAFQDWWDTGVLPELELEGYSIQHLMKEHGMSPIAALLTLDWLKRNPEEAITSLDKGHDWVG